MTGCMDIVRFRDDGLLQSQSHVYVIQYTLIDDPYIILFDSDAIRVSGT